MNRFLLFIAEGFGIGRIPVAPGTFGSVLGTVWFALLLWPRSLPLFVIGMLAGLASSIWLCGVAEKVLQKTDPGSVVLDEIVVMPVCFSGWLGVLIFRHGAMPDWNTFFSGKNLWLTLAVLVIFRVLDILKPWPIRTSQSLPGGWGVTIDDLLAAILTALITGWLASR